MHLNATEAQWRNVQQQYMNNDCGIFRRQSSYATLSRDHVGAAAADSWIFNTILYRFEQAEPKVLRCENVNSSSFIPRSRIHTVSAKGGRFCLGFTTPKIRLSVNLVLRIRIGFM